MKNCFLIWLILFLSGGVLFSCSSKNEGTPELLSAFSETDQRVRPAIKKGTSAAYFNYINTSGATDTLLSVHSEVAGMAQVHETYETMDGMMGMRPQKEIVLPAGDTLKFKQGGMHIMLMELKQDLTEGDSVIIQLQLARSGMVEQKLPVKATEQ